MKYVRLFIWLLCAVCFGYDFYQWGGIKDTPLVGNELMKDAPKESFMAVTYMVVGSKANGTLAEKVFKLATPVLGPGESRTFSKRHAFRQMTTRVHHPGDHALQLQVNGVRYPATGFTVET